jgi:hypothetical protein
LTGAACTTPSKVENKSEITVKVWGLLQWMQDSLRAEQDPDHEWPMEFYGRALRYYRNDSSGLGRAIERAQIMPSLVKIGIFIV